MSKRLDKYLRLELQKDKKFSSRYENYLTRDVLNDLVPLAVLVNGKKKKKGYKVKHSDSVIIDHGKIKSKLDSIIADKKALRRIDPELDWDSYLDIVTETDDYLILNKPSDLVMHPGVGNTSGTLANYLRGYLESKGEYDGDIVRAGIVHRLDKGVSGLLICAKNRNFQLKLKEEFENRRVEKAYLAKIIDIENIKASYDRIQYMTQEDIALTRNVLSSFSNSEGAELDWKSVEGYIGRNPDDRIQMQFSKIKIHPSWRSAESRLLKLAPDLFLVHIVTGRMHQIRATFNFLEKVVVGDSLYGDKRFANSDSIELRSVYLEFPELNIKASL